MATWDRIPSYLRKQNINPLLPDQGSLQQYQPLQTLLVSFTTTINI